jgi:hypothetical protein
MTTRLRPHDTIGAAMPARMARLARETRDVVTRPFCQLTRWVAMP